MTAPRPDGDQVEPTPARRFTLPPELSSPSAVLLTVALLVGPGLVTAGAIWLFPGLGTWIVEVIARSPEPFVITVIIVILGFGAVARSERLEREQERVPERPLDSEPEQEAAELRRIAKNREVREDVSIPVGGWVLVVGVFMFAVVISFWGELAAIGDTILLGMNIWLQRVHDWVIAR